MNDKNIEFYKKINLDKFKEFARLIGLDTKIDIDLIYPYIQSAKILVELGAGYGRVISALLERNFQGQVIAFERVSELVNYLKDQFSHELLSKKITLIEADFKNFSITQQADVVLWLWSGFLELSEKEQRENVKHICNNLTENGVLVIEIPIEVKHIGEQAGNQIIRVETEWGTIEAYMPRYDELLDYAKYAGFVEVERKDYLTATSLKRTIYIFKKCL
ncbi:MAG: class I SAM-dependent methyltransferase [Thermoflexibacter sp.]|nr:class I SAM-dependent methyltransferase [Thermoflexibacter sp.]